MDKQLILHMICQLHQLKRGGGATVGDVARYMDVTKPTARKRLGKLVNDGFLLKREITWRKNAVCHVYSPTVETQIMYDRGEFKEAYQKRVREIALKNSHLVQRSLI